MTTIYNRREIERVIEPAEVIGAVEQAFVAYSKGEAVIPPVAGLEFEEPPGDCHIKYGYLKRGNTFTIKIATGFWRNPERGLASSNGVVLLFSSETGELLTIFQDEGFLTDARTAAAGAVAAKHLAPPEVDCIGIIGAGLQAKLQLDYLREVTKCRRVRLWARNSDRAHALKADGFDIEVASSAAEVAARSQLIVTTTAARRWLLGSQDIRPGTHITAVGADGGGKQELEPALFARAQIRAVDSLSQCAEYGDSSYALQEHLIERSQLTELGALIAEPARRRAAPDISIADLTGVAVQDMAIAELALKRLRA